MKSKYIAALLGLGLAASASAATEIRLTGSTAFRSSIHTAILAKMGSSATYAYIGTSSVGVGGSNQAIFTGTIDGQAVIVKTAWSGSADGIHKVASGTTVAYLSNSTTQSSSGTPSVPTGTEQLVPTAAFSDVYQGSTVYTTPTLTDTIVAIAPFKWIASASAPTSLTNITPQLVQALYGAGTLPLALFTGNAADQGTTVYALGRDPDSGTRITAFAEAGLGPFAGVVQYVPTINGSNEVTAFNPTPANPTNGWVLGNTGASSGSALSTQLKATSTTQNAVMIGYLGLSDASNAILGGAKELTYNGVAYSADNTRQGKYTFWCYEHLLYPSSLSGIAKNIVDSIGVQLNTVPGAAGISAVQGTPGAAGSFDVYRPTDGATVVPNY